MSTERLGIGFVGSGFNARFHIQSLTSVREIDVRGVWSPNEKNAASSAALARELDVGEARPYKSIRDMVADPAINALWLCGPNQARIANIEEIVAAIKSGAGTLRGLACEKPLARNVAEAKSGRPGAQRRPEHRISGEPAVLARHHPRTRADLGARRVADGPSLPRPSGRRAQRRPICPGSGRGRSRAAECSTT